MIGAMNIFIGVDGGQIHITYNSVTSDLKLKILVSLDVYGLKPSSNGVPRINNFSSYLTFGKGELN